jgi:FixJ family two-component response regulator
MEVPPAHDSRGVARAHPVRTLGRWERHEADRVSHDGPIVFVVMGDAETRDRVRELAELAGLHVRTYVDAATFLRELSAEQPGCLVLGAGGGSQDGLGLLQELGHRRMPMPAIVMTLPGDVSTAVAAVRAGAVDVVEKHTLAERTVPCIFRALAMDLGARARRLENGQTLLRYTNLSRRERQVLQLVMEGETSSAIAGRLGLREKTVEIYRSHINKKMRTRNAAELTSKVMHSMA